MPARILVIEDNPTNLELMTYLLSAHGYEPLIAMDGVEGIEAGERERPDLIVCDIQLPKADGFEVVRRLRGRTEFKKVPFIAVTALAMVGDRERLLHAGFDGYLAKPILPESFIQEIEAFLSSDLRSLAHAVQPSYAEDRTTPRVVAPSKATVLVVDDTDANRELLRSLLEPNGYTVVTASSLAAAAAELRRARPDLLLTDLHLQDGNALDFVRTLRADPELRTLPILFQSASAEELQLREIRALGTGNTIGRPLEAERLLHEIETILSEQTLAPAGEKE